MTDGSGPYRVMPHPRLCAGELELRAVEPDEIELIREWRNTQMDVLRQSAPITPEMQRHYFETSVWPEKTTAEPKQILLSIRWAGVFSGYGGLVHLSWPDLRGEVSFLLNPELERQAEARASILRLFLGLMQKLAFVDLGLRRLFTETFAHRAKHIATLEAAGFLREGCLRGHVVVDGQPTDAIVHGCLSTEREKWG
jgi:RimJ/RimL family protein N-acetyltransferase